jgi:hypothetical protein
MSSLVQEVDDQEGEGFVSFMIWLTDNDIFEWINDRGLWFLVSGVLHMSALIMLSLIIIVTPGREGQAPEFEAEVDSALPDPILYRFDVGNPPIEPTVLDTRMRRDFQEQPITQTNLKIDDNSQFIEATSVSNATDNSSAVGRLGEFSAQAVGAGSVGKSSDVIGGGTENGGGNILGESEGQGFASRGQGKRQAVLGTGGTKATERSVAAALH